jgi:hypothetical protein
MGGVMDVSILHTSWPFFLRAFVAFGSCFIGYGSFETCSCMPF